MKSIKTKIDEIKNDEDIGFPLPRVEFGANKIAYVDGSAGVVEYNESTVRLSSGEYILKFSGDALTIKSMTEEQIVISGNIMSLEFFT